MKQSNNNMLTFMTAKKLNIIKPFITRFHSCNEGTIMMPSKLLSYSL